MYWSPDREPILRAHRKNLDQESSVSLDALCHVGSKSCRIEYTSIIHCNIGPSTITTVPYSYLDGRGSGDLASSYKPKQVPSQF